MPVIDAVVEQESSFSLFDFFNDLRKKIVFSFVALVLFTIPCTLFWRKLVELIMLYPLKGIEPKPELIFTAPQEAVILSLKVGILGGFLLSAPVIAFNFWSLFKSTTFSYFKIAVLVLISSALLVSGLGFSYLLLPLMLQFLTSFSVGAMEALFTINEYTSFIVRMSVACGIVFQLPIIAFVLTKINLINHRFMIKYGRFAVVLAFVCGALLTPPDIVSQLFMAAPLLILYGVSIGVSFIFRKKAL